VTQPGSERPDAREFWIARGDMAKDVAAVSPGSANSAYENWTRGCLQEWALRRARRHLGPRFRRAVDLGCGYGDWTVRFAAMADEVIACDVSPGFAEEAARRLRESGHQAATVVCGDVRGFDGYRDADLVYLGAVLMYLDDDGCVSLLRSVRERIAPRGLLLSRDWCAIRLGRARVNTTPWFSVHRRARRYVELAEQAGFRVIESASSTSIYGEEMAYRYLARRSEAATAWLRWPARLPWTAASLFWTRGSVSFVMRPA